mmetsp:Transcript_22840/g.58081  ORF Transcript_22840/g.58081 Transcript_22840/m.58081 type:complete len:212 (-) Transcript_22840:2504-3139(-)
MKRVHTRPDDAHAVKLGCLDDGRARSHNTAPPHVVRGALCLAGAISLFGLRSPESHPCLRPLVCHSYRPRSSTRIVASGSRPRLVRGHLGVHRHAGRRPEHALQVRTAHHSPTSLLANLGVDVAALTSPMLRRGDAHPRSTWGHPRIPPASHALCPPRILLLPLCPPAPVPLCCRPPEHRRRSRHMISSQAGSYPPGPFRRQPVPSCCTPP